MYTFLPHNVYILRQSKGKERRGKRNIENESSLTLTLRAYVREDFN